MSSVSSSYLVLAPCLDDSFNSELDKKDNGIGFIGLPYYEGDDKPVGLVTLLLFSRQHAVLEKNYQVVGLPG